MTTNEHNVIGISGSLRKGSFNSACLRAAAMLAPVGMKLEVFDLSPIPLYNEDVRENGFPPSVEELRKKIAQADGLLIVTPEYNYSIPGVLKNAVDWVSRPPEQPFESKPIAIMGASPSMLGTARAQYHLRQCFVYLNGIVMNRPEVFIAGANQKIDADGNLTDEKTKQVITSFLTSFSAWMARAKQTETHQREQRHAS